MYSCIIDIVSARTTAVIFQQYFSDCQIPNCNSPTRQTCHTLRHATGEQLDYVAQHSLSPLVPWFDGTGYSCIVHVACKVVRHSTAFNHQCSVQRCVTGEVCGLWWCSRVQYRVPTSNEKCRLVDCSAGCCCAV